MAEKEGVTFVGQIYDVRTKKDGSGRIQIDFSADAIDDIQIAQRMSMKQNLCWQIALVPVRQEVIPSGHGDSREYEPDENGEIPL